MNEVGANIHFDPIYWVIYAANLAPYAGALFYGSDERAIYLINRWGGANLRGLKWNCIDCTGSP